MSHKNHKKNMSYLAIVMIYAIFGIFVFTNISLTGELEGSASSLLLKYGSRGEQVKTVQTKLKNWGYYNGKVDGVYGWITKESVIKFQRKNGLKADGIIGDATAKALGMPVTTTASKSGTSQNNDVYTLGQCIYGEGRGESYTGQVAIGAVIINRVNNPKFPNTIAGVIFQPGAFTAVADGQMFMKPNETALKAARDALNGWDPSGGAIYYYNPAKTTNKWIWSRPIVKVIGKHYFCK